MHDEATNPTAVDATPNRPLIVDRATWQAELDELRTREKAHTRAGDAIAAARRKLPMVEVDPTITVIGPDGPITLLDAFEGRQQLIAYYFMWYAGKPAAEQCEGCTRAEQVCRLTPPMKRMPRSKRDSSLSGLGGLFRLGRRSRLRLGAGWGGLGLAWVLLLVL
jgi:Bacterial protein of unknown function (DUF899)